MLGLTLLPRAFDVNVHIDTGSTGNGGGTLRAPEGGTTQREMEIGMLPRPRVKGPVYGKNTQNRHISAVPPSPPPRHPRMARRGKK